MVLKKNRGKKKRSPERLIEAGWRDVGSYVWILFLTFI